MANDLRFQAIMKDYLLEVGSTLFDLLLADLGEYCFYEI